MSSLGADVLVVGAEDLFGIGYGSPARTALAYSLGSNEG